jgi:hypothetical protein
MADEHPEQERGETPLERDARQPVAGRQPQRPGQHGKYQPRPGERDPETLPSAEPEGFSGPEAPAGALPSAQKPRLGHPQDAPDEE